MTFSNTAILGLQWGDEGKGKIVNYLAEILVRHVGTKGGTMLATH